MTNIKQSLLVAICTLVSMSIINAVDAGATASRSIRAGAQGCVRRTVVAQQATQPMSQQLPSRKAPINTPVLVDEPEAITQKAQPMSQQLPTMQAPATLDINEPALEKVDVLAQLDKAEQLPASENATEQTALKAQPSALDMIPEPNAPERPEESFTAEEEQEEQEEEERVML